MDVPPTAPLPRLRLWLMHVACVVSLAWPALINGQPFYFPDTTAYVRAADIAVYMASGKRISTAWTEHYADAVADLAVSRSADTKSEGAAHGNDLGSGRIMAGRSPYFGAVLWVSYVVSLFWLFVVAQALVSYTLIRLSCRMLGLGGWRPVAVMVAILSLVTTLPFYVGLLMPDLLAAFAMLAFVLLAIDRGRLGRRERWALGGLMMASAISHLTHIWIVAAMAATLIVARLWRGHGPQKDSASALISAALAILLGLGSVALTDSVVERQFGRAPQLVPLLTARFLADGPGRAYLRTHCPQAGFAICAYRDRPPLSAPAFLWATAPGEGIYLLASPAERAAMASQDKAFAWAVIAAYPIEQGAKILRNSGAQLIRFDSQLLNDHCNRPTPCGLALPDADRRRLMHSLGGRSLWPQRLITTIHYGAVGFALIMLAAWGVSMSRGRATNAERDLARWAGLIAIGMIINAMLGGAVSEVQTRYQARIIWLLPFVATLAAMLWRQRSASMIKR